MEYGGDTTSVGMHCPGPNTKRDHQHTGHRTVRDPVEDGGVSDKHPYICASLNFHYGLNRFKAGRDTGTGIMELDLSQKLAIIYQYPLLLVFLYLSKAYETVDRKRLLMTLEGCGAVSCLCVILETFWVHQQLVPRHNGFHKPAFPATRGATQGGLVSLTFFNVVVENFIRTWMTITVEEQRVNHDRLVETSGRCLGVFYVNDGMVISRDADWLQHAMNILVGLFRWYSLENNVVKSCTMMCQPDALRFGVYAEAKALKYTGVVYSYCVRL